MTTEQTTHTVMAEVTAEQYEMLRANAISTNLLIYKQAKHTEIYGERNIPEMIRTTMWEILVDEYENGDDSDENEENCKFYDNIESDLMDLYLPAILNWPLSVKSQILAHMKVDCESENAGTVHVVYLDMSLEDAKVLYGEFPQLRTMFQTDPAEVATWFR